MGPDYDDKPKRSWREIDKVKDSSKHRQPDRPVAGKKKERAAAASRVYKSKLDAFFEGQGKPPAHVKDKLESLKSSEAGQERAEALKAIKEANTAAAADQAVSAYLERWELPPDYEILSQLLICSDEAHVAAAISEIEKLFAEKRVPRSVQIVEQRLRRVKTLAEDPDLQERAGELMKRLRLFS